MQDIFSLQEIKFHIEKINLMSLNLKDKIFVLYKT